MKHTIMNKKTSHKTIKKTLPMKRIRVGKLQNTQQVALFQARTIKRAIRGDGECINDCYKIVMMGSMLAKTLETSDLERRIEALENKSMNK
jgi:hypothetical protein